MNIYIYININFNNKEHITQNVNILDLNHHTHFNTTIRRSETI